MLDRADKGFAEMLAGLSASLASIKEASVVQEMYMANVAVVLSNFVQRALPDAQHGEHFP